MYSLTVGSACFCYQLCFSLLMAVTSLLHSRVFFSINMSNENTKWLFRHKKTKALQRLHKGKSMQKVAAEYCKLKSGFLSELQLKA
jgi:hypothetical protein